MHKDQLWGDINVVNGVPWPVLDIKSTWHRFRVLNASPSRPWNLQVGHAGLLPVSHTLPGPCVLSAVCTYCNGADSTSHAHVCCQHAASDICSCHQQLLASLQFRNAAGKEIGSQKCYIIGSDGGIIPNADKHMMPANGLLTDVAYRWDIICDFTGYTDKVSIPQHVHFIITMLSIVESESAVCDCCTC